jgi:RND family efflux transporter MFP subunit
MRSTRRKGVRWLVLLAILASGVGGVAARHALSDQRGREGEAPSASEGHAEAKPAPAAEVIAVTTELPARRKAQRAVEVVGTLHGRDEVEISAKVEGQVIRIHHDIGDVVAPGDLLLEIDPTDYRIAIAEGQRGLELELSRLGLGAMPTSNFDVAQLPSVVRASARAWNAEARLARFNRLGAGGAVTIEDRQQAQTDHQVAKAEHQQAILEAQATLASARQREASLETFGQRLKDTKVVVPRPSDGASEYVVCKREVAEGEMVRSMPGSSTALFQLVIDQPLKLKVTVPERHKGEIRPDQDVDLSVDAYPGERFRGRVARISPSIDRASRTFQVEVTVPNDDRRLSPGAFAKASILTRVDPDALAIPEEALVSFAGVTKVFVLREGKAKEVLVRAGEAAPGEDQRTWIEVAGDLPGDAPVITSGQTRLADGVAVRLREPRDPAREAR